MSKKVNEITVCRDEYKSEEAFENAIKDAIMVLLNNGYIMTVQYDDKELGVVWIKYEYANREFGCAYPLWLFPHEEDSVIYEDDLK